MTLIRGNYLKCLKILISRTNTHIKVSNCVLVIVSASVDLRISPQRRLAVAGTLQSSQCEQSYFYGQTIFDILHLRVKV